MLNLTAFPNTTTDVVAHTGHWNLKVLQPAQFQAFLWLYFQALLRLTRALAQPPTVTFVSSFAVHPHRLVSSKQAWLTTERVALWNRLGLALAAGAGMRWVDAFKVSVGSTNDTPDGIHNTAGGLWKVFQPSVDGHEAQLGVYQKVCRQLIQIHRLLQPCAAS